MVSGTQIWPRGCGFGLRDIDLASGIDVLPQGHGSDIRSGLCATDLVSRATDLTSGLQI